MQVRRKPACVQIESIYTNCMEYYTIWRILKSSHTYSVEYCIESTDLFVLLYLDMVSGAVASEMGTFGDMAGCRHDDDDNGLVTQSRQLLFALCMLSVGEER